MAISATAMSPTQFGGFQASLPGLTSNGAQNPFASLALPAINTGVAQGSQNTLQGLMGGGSAQSGDIYTLLAGAAPQSLTSAIGPLLSQVYGTQNNLMQPIFSQMGAQNAATAQSNAQARGLTGSSIESSNIQQAYNQANQGYAQYLAGQLSSLVPTYLQAAQSDVSNQMGYNMNLAGAAGQQLSSQIQQQQFAQALYAASQGAGMMASAQSQSGLFGMLGSLGGGIGGGLALGAMLG